MSKNSLYLIAAIAIAATAATFFMTKNGPQVACTQVIHATDIGVITARPAASGTQSLASTERGYPFEYYRDPVSANTSCIPTAQTSGGFNTAHLAYDAIVWAAVGFLLFLPSALLNWWRGPAMLGDNVRQV